MIFILLLRCMFYESDLHNSPFIRIVIPFILGIISFISLPQLFGYWLFILLSFLIISYFLLNSLKIFYRNFYVSKYLGILGLVILFFFGYVYTGLFQSEVEQTFNNSSGLIMGRVIEPTQDKDKSIKVVVDIEAFKKGQEWISSQGRAIIYVNSKKTNEKIEPGDKILFEPKLQEISNPGNPHEFDYKKYLAFNLISHQAFIRSNEWVLIKSGNEFNLQKQANRLRSYILQLYEQSGLKGQELAVAAALSLGYKDDLDAEIKQSYSSSGAMHVLAVSGLHVGVIFLVFNYLLFFLNKNYKTRLIKGIIIILLLWLYAFLTGLSPSVMRATIMFTFVVLGQILSRHTNTYNTLAASAFLILLLNPFNLTNIGFQMSYIAVIGILFFYPLIHKMIYVKNKALDWIWSLIAVSIAAQLVTGPISLYYFHQFPNYFILTNIIVIPISTIIIYSIAVLLLFSWNIELLIYPGKFVSFITSWLNQSVQWIENLPGSVSSNINIDGFQTLFLYGLIFTLTFYLLKRNIHFLYTSLIFIILFLINDIIKELNVTDRKQIYVYNIKGYTAINLVDNNNNYLFSDLEKSNKNYQFSMKNNWVKLGLESEKLIPLHKLNNQFIISNMYYLDNTAIFFKDNFLAFYDRKIAWVNDTELMCKNDSCYKMNVDYVIVSKNPKVQISEILQNYNCKKIIIDSSNSKYKIDKWKAEASAMGIELFIVSEKGAFFDEMSG